MRQGRSLAQIHQDGEFFALKDPGKPRFRHPAEPLAIPNDGHISKP
jgi:hypothetical protein